MKNNQNNTLLAIAISIILVNIALDQITKEYARENYKGKGTIEIIDDFFVVHYAENDGAFLSFGSNLTEPFKTLLLTIVPAIFLLAFTLYIFFHNKHLSRIQLVCISTIIGGGISNIFDRIFFGGFVTDFMNFGIGSLRTGILNFADMSITFGAIILIIVQFIKEKQDKKAMQ